MCPDAPVPVFIPRKTTEGGGMARNVQRNISSLGVECDVLCNSERITKTRYVDEKTNHMFLRVDSNEEEIRRIEGDFCTRLEDYDAIVVSDYDKGYLTREDISKICNSHPLVYVDTKKPLGQWLNGSTYIKINEAEFQSSRPYSTLEALEEKLIVTLSSSGCRHRGEIYPVERVDVKDSSGAGDTFLAGLVVKYLETSDIASAIEFANECATNVVQHRGVNSVGEL